MKLKLTLYFCTIKIMETKKLKPIIGITIGDFNGIGPEIILKTIADIEITKFFTPVIYASVKLLNKYRKLLQLSEEHPFQFISDIKHVVDRKINVFNCWQEDYEPEPGKITEIAGKCAYISLKTATEHLKSGSIEGMVTAPINKKNIQRENFNFIGHTEYLQAEFNAPDVLMFMVSEHIKVAVVSMHVPVNKIVTDITKEKIESKLNLMMASLKKDFGISKPKIAVLGLNPHAGDGGAIGNEDIDIIKPLIENYKNKGEIVMGPFPADGFFAAESYRKFDAVLAMYHDQGLTPFKMLAFEDGVNFTAGLKAIRTSPDHGTAYDIAGKGVANESSFRQALFMVTYIIKARNNHL